MIDNFFEESSELGDADPSEPAPAQRRRWLGRAVVTVEIAVIVVVLLVAAAVWIGLRALAAADHLDDLRRDVNNVRSDLLDGRDAQADLASSQRDARAAQHDTHDPVWWLASWLPPVHTVRGLATVSNNLAEHSLPPLVKVGSSVEPSHLRVNRNTIALAPLAAAAPTLQQADSATATARRQVAGLSGGWFGPITTARDKVLSQLTSLSGSVDDATRFAEVGPSMLGADGERRYFVGIQNNAESRGTGGLVAAYAIVTADHGTIKVASRGNDSKLRNASHSVVDLGADYDQFYGGYDGQRIWDDSNISPNFPDAANIWAHLWQAQSGQRIDGAFGVDPYALSALVGVTGPIRVKGTDEVFTKSNLAAFIESGEYVAFAHDSKGRKPFVSRVAGATLHGLLSGSGSASALASTLGAAAGAGHLELWAARPAEEARISGTPLAGAIPQTSRPFAALTVVNKEATKLDYYTERSLTYTAGACSGSTRPSTITVTLTNAAPKQGLPAYVTDSAQRRRTAGASQPLLVFVHATHGAGLIRATLDGRPVLVAPGMQQGHPVFEVDVTLPPRVPQTLVFHLDEPTASGAALSKVQPLARPQRTRLDVPVCS